MSNSYPPDVRFDFPLPRPHCGIALGNGTLGILVWGDEFLCLTIARAGFWDHRGGNEFTTKATFPRVRELLEARDENGLRVLFANPPADELTPHQPYQIGGARLEIRFKDGGRPISGTLKVDGSLEIELQTPAGARKTVRIECSMDDEVAWLENVEGAQLRLRPTWEWVGEKLEKLGIGAPHQIGIEDGLGFVQELPDDDALALVVRKREGRLFVATALGEVEEAAKAAVTRARQKPDINPIYYWKQFWRAAPRVNWPDAQLQHCWDIALFEQAQFTATENAETDETAKMDATAGFITAFTELLIQDRRDGIYVLPAIPRRWRELSFDGIRCEGAFLVGADVKNGAVVEVRVKSEKGGKLRLFGGVGVMVEREMSAGENWVWRAD